MIYREKDIQSLKNDAVKSGWVPVIDSCDLGHITTGLLLMNISTLCQIPPPQKAGSFCSEKTGNYELPMKCQGSIYFPTYTFQFWQLPRVPSQIRYVVKLGIIKGIKKNSIRYEGFHVFFQLRKVRPGSISSWVRNVGTTGTTGSFRELAELRQAVFKS